MYSDGSSEKAHSRQSSSTALIDRPIDDDDFDSKESFNELAVLNLKNSKALKWMAKKRHVSGWILGGLVVFLIICLSSIAVLGHAIYRSTSTSASSTSKSSVDSQRPSDETTHGKIPVTPKIVDSYHLGCTMDTCFNRTKCGVDSSQFSFYLYPRPSDYDPYAMYEPTFPDYNKARSRALWDDMYCAFEKSPFRTMDPSKACLYIPYFDTSASATVSSRASFEKIEKALNELPSWNGSGENHLVFDRHEDDFQPFNPQKAVLFRASLHSHYMRRNFDHGWQFRAEYFPCSFSKNEQLARMMRAVPIQERLPIGFFRGIQSHSIRTKMMGFFKEENAQFLQMNQAQLFVEGQVANGNFTDVNRLEGRKKLFAPELSFYRYKIPCCSIEDRNCYLLVQDSQDKASAQGDYCSLFGTSLFGLNPRGKGLLTYRTMEILQVGSIHVYIGDDYELPYSDILDWRQFSIIVPEIYACKLNEILSLDNYSLERLQQIQQRANYLYSTYFETFEKELPLIFASLKAKIYRDWKLPSDLDPFLNTFLRNPK